MEVIKSGDFVEYIDACQVLNPETGKKVLTKVAKQGIWDGSKVILNDKEQTNVRNLDYLKKINYLKIS